MTNKAFQDQLTFVSTEMVGVTDRLNNPTGYHPLLKSDWGISDKFRGLLGNYYTPVETVNPSLASVAMINYSEVYDSPLLYAFVQMPGTSQTLGQQVVGPNEGTNRMFDVALVEQSDRTTVALTYDDAGWKSAGYNLTWPAAPNYFDATPSSARSAAASSVPPAEIEDRLSRFMGTYDNALPYARIGADPNTVATAIVNDAPIPGTPVPGIFHGSSDFVDYPIQLSAPSAHVSIREKAEDRLSLTSHYVQYVDSIPSLESVVNNPAVSENLLPNAYYLQLELQNESTIPLANGRYVNALSLKYSNDYNGSYVDWFDNLGQGQLTELNQNQFYEEYARGLNEAIFEDNLEALNTALDYTKNLFVLHTDRNMLTGDSINVSTVPFYNTIRIPADMPTGYKPEISILGDLASDPEYAADNLIDLLQYSAIENLESSNNSTLSFTQVLKKINTASGYNNPSDVSYTLHTGEYVSVYNVNNKVEQYLGAGLPDSPPLMNLPSPMGPSPAPPSLAIPENNGPLGGQLAENIEDDDFIGVQNASSLNNRVGSVEIGDSTQSSMDLLSLAPKVTRRYAEVLNGRFCHLETLMFVIKKYRVHETGETLVQTFYLTNRFDGDDIVFHDSQVKTKQKYRYDIQKVTIVFGSKYSYDVYQTPNPTEKNLALLPQGGGPAFMSGQRGPAATRRYQASVDVFEDSSYMEALMVPHVVGGIVTILDDKPPVCPDMSFYPFRGVSDQLKILLQPTTGVRTEKPIVIEPEDVGLFLGEYLAQTGIDVDTIANIPELEFRSDDPVDAYQIFKITTKPESYNDFAGSMITVDPRLGRAGALDDTIVPNTIYYYCARSVDINGNVSNPTHIFEVEMIETAGQIFLRLEVFTFETQKPKFITEGRRFIYVEPALQQLALPDTQNVGQPNIYNPPNSSILGTPNISKVWGETFKIRVRSTKTGRKLDLNLTFKNTGIVNPSE